MTVSLEDQIAAVRREIKMRERACPRWVANEKMSQAKADAELAAMRAVLETLVALKPPEPQRTLLL